MKLLGIIDIFSEDDAYDAIVPCVPTVRDKKARDRNWESYAESTADYAFGFAGDRDLLRNSRYVNLFLHNEYISMPMKISANELLIITL